jgi:hypothetical protein
VTGSPMGGGSVILIMIVIGFAWQGLGKLFT